VLTAARTDLNVVSNNSVTANFAMTSIPVISLIGAKHIIIYKDQEYKDPGVTAYDSVDGNLNNIRATSTVNTSVAGNYTIKYNTENSSHVAAVEMIRTVEVKPVEAIKSTISNSVATNIYIPATVAAPTIDLTSLTSTPSGLDTLVLLPAEINITKTTSIGDVVVNIPAGTNLTLNTNTWDGVINLPQTNSNPKVNASSGTEASVFSSVEIGLEDTPITFDKAVKITFPGAKDKLVGWSRANEFTKITDNCLNNSQSWADSNIGVGSDCKINAGDDLVVWTKHFTTYTVYTESVSSQNTNSVNIPILVNPESISESTKLDFVINKVINSNKLNISLNADPKTVSGYAISLDSNFTNSSIIKYSPNLVFDLPNIYGKYTIYLKYFSTSGHQSPVITKTIDYTPINPLVVQKNDNVKESNYTKIGKFNFKKDLKVGQNSPDVKELQKYLNDNNFLVSKSGLGSKGKETTNFGLATKAALIRFQKAKKINPAIGVFGPVTRKIINKS
jgi:hypothetical protein